MSRGTNASNNIHKQGIEDTCGVTIFVILNKLGGVISTHAQKNSSF